jgi:hypothetical protein
MVSDMENRMIKQLLLLTALGSVTSSFAFAAVPTSDDVASKRLATFGVLRPTDLLTPSTTKQMNEPPVKAPVQEARRKKRIPGGSGCDSVRDRIEHPECRPQKKRKAT